MPVPGERSATVPGITLRNCSLDEVAKGSSPRSPSGISVGRRQRPIGVHYDASATIISFDASQSYIFLATQNTATLLSATSSVLVARYSFSATILCIAAARNDMCMYVLTNDGVLYMFKAKNGSYNTPSATLVDLLHSGDVGRCITLAATNKKDIYEPIVELTRTLSDARIALDPNGDDSLLVSFHATFDAKLHLPSVNVILHCRSFDQVTAYYMRHRATALCYGNFGVSFIGDDTGRIYFLLSSESLKEQVVAHTIPVSTSVPPVTPEFSNFIFFLRAYPEGIRQIHCITPVVIFIGYIDGMMLTLNIKSKTVMKHDIACTNTYQAGRTKTRVVGKPGIKARALLGSDPLIGNFYLSNHKEFQNRLLQYNTPESSPQHTIHPEKQQDEQNGGCQEGDFLQEYIKIKEHLLNEDAEGMMEELLDTFVEEWDSGRRKHASEFFSQPKSHLGSTPPSALPKPNCILTKGFDSSQVALIDDYLILFVGLKGHLVAFNLTAYDDSISKPIYLENLLKGSIYKFKVSTGAEPIHLKIHSGRLLIQMGRIIHTASLPQFLLPTLSYVPHFGTFRFYSRGELDPLGNSEDDYPYDVSIIFTTASVAKPSPFLKKYRELHEKSLGWDHSIDLSVKSSVAARIADQYMDTRLYQEVLSSDAEGIGALTKSDPRSLTGLSRYSKETRSPHTEISSVVCASTTSPSSGGRPHVKVIPSESSALAHAHLRIARESLIRERMLQNIMKRFEYGQENPANYLQFSPKQGIYNRYKEIAMKKTDRYDHTHFMPLTGFPAKIAKGRHRRLHSLSLEREYWGVIEKRSRRGKGSPSHTSPRSSKYRRSVHEEKTRGATNEYVFENELSLSDLCSMSTSSSSQESSDLASVSGDSFYESRTGVTNNSVVSDSPGNEDGTGSRGIPLDALSHHSQQLSKSTLQDNSMRPIVDLLEHGREHSASFCDKSTVATETSVTVGSPPMVLDQLREHSIVNAIEQAMLLSHEGSDADDPHTPTQQTNLLRAPYLASPSSKLEEKRIDNLVSFILSYNRPSKSFPVASRYSQVRSFPTDTQGKPPHPYAGASDGPSSASSTSWPRIRRIAELCSLSEVLSKNREYTAMAAAMVHILKLPYRDSSSERIKKLLYIHKGQKIFNTLVETDLFTEYERSVLRDTFEDAKYYYQQLGVPAININKLRPSTTVGTSQWRAYIEGQEVLPMRRRDLKPDMYFQYPGRNITSALAAQHARADYAVSAHAAQNEVYARGTGDAQRSEHRPIKELQGMQVFTYNKTTPTKVCSREVRPKQSSGKTSAVFPLSSSSQQNVAAPHVPSSKKLVQDQGSVSASALRSSSSPVKRSKQLPYPTKERESDLMATAPNPTSVQPSECNPSAASPPAMATPKNILLQQEIFSAEDSGRAPDNSLPYSSIQVDTDDPENLTPGLTSREREGRIFHSSPKLSDLYNSRSSKHALGSSKSEGQAHHPKSQPPSILSSLTSSSKQPEPCSLSASVGPIAKVSSATLDHHHSKATRAVSTPALSRKQSAKPQVITSNLEAMRETRETHHTWLKAKAQSKNTVRVTVFSGIPKYYDIRTRIEYAHKHQFNTVQKRDLTRSMEGVGDMVYRTTNQWPPSMLDVGHHRLHVSAPYLHIDDEAYGSNLVTDEASGALSGRTELSEIVHRPQWSAPANYTRRPRGTASISRILGPDFLPSESECKDTANANAGPVLVDLNQQIQHILDAILTDAFGDNDAAIGSRRDSHASVFTPRMQPGSDERNRISMPRTPVYQEVLPRHDISPNSLARVSSALGNIVYKLTVMRRGEHRPTHDYSEVDTDLGDEAWNNAVEQINTVFPEMLRKAGKVRRRIYPSEQSNVNLDIGNLAPIQFNSGPPSPLREEQFNLLPQGAKNKQHGVTNIDSYSPISRNIHMVRPNASDMVTSTGLSPPKRQNMGLDGVESAKYMRSLAKARSRFSPYSLKDVLRVFSYLDVTVGANGEIRSLNADRLTNIYRTDPEIYGCADKEEDSEHEAPRRISSGLRRKTIESSIALADSSYRFPFICQSADGTTDVPESNYSNYLAEAVSKQAAHLENIRKELSTSYSKIGREPSESNQETKQTQWEPTVYLADYAPPGTAENDLLPANQVFASQDTDISIQISRPDLARLLVRTANIRSPSRQIKALESLLPESVRSDVVLREQILTFLDEKHRIMEQKNIKCDDLVQLQRTVVDYTEHTTDLHTAKRPSDNILYDSKVSLMDPVGRSVNEQLKSQSQEIDIITLDVINMNTTKYTAKPVTLLHSAIFSPKKFCSMRQRAIMAKKKLQDKQDTQTPELIVPAVYFHRDELERHRAALKPMEASISKIEFPSISVTTRQNADLDTNALLLSTGQDLTISSLSAISTASNIVHNMSQQGNQLHKGTRQRASVAKHDIYAANVELRIQAPVSSIVGKSSRVAGSLTNIRSKVEKFGVYAKHEDSGMPPIHPQHMSNLVRSKLMHEDSVESSRSTEPPPKSSLKKSAKNALGTHGYTRKSTEYSLTAMMDDDSVTHFDSAPEVGLVTNMSFQQKIMDLQVQSSRESYNNLVSSRLSETSQAMAMSIPHSIADDLADNFAIYVDPDFNQDSTHSTHSTHSMHSAHSTLPPRPSTGTLRPVTLNLRIGAFSSLNEFIKAMPHPSEDTTISLRDRALLLAMAQRSPYTLRSATKLMTEFGIELATQTETPTNKTVTRKKGSAHVSPVASASNSIHSARSSFVSFSRSSSPTKWSEDSDMPSRPGSRTMSPTAKTKRVRTKTYTYGTLTPTEGFSTKPGRSQSCCDLFNHVINDYTPVVQACLLDYQSHDHTKVAPHFAANSVLTKLCKEAEQKPQLTPQQLRSVSQPLAPLDNAYTGTVDIVHVPPHLRSARKDVCNLNPGPISYNIRCDHPQILNDTNTDSTYKSFREASSAQLSAFKREAEVFRAQQLLVLAENLTSLSAHLHSFTQRALHAEYYNMATYGTYAETETQVSGLRRHRILIYYNVPFWASVKPENLFQSALHTLPASDGQMVLRLEDMAFADFLRRDVKEIDALHRLQNCETINLTFNADQKETSVHTWLKYPEGKRPRLFYKPVADTGESLAQYNTSINAVQGLPDTFPHVLIVPPRSKSARCLRIDRRRIAVTRSTPRQSKSNSYRQSRSPSPSHHSDSMHSFTALSRQSNFSIQHSSFDSNIELCHTSLSRRPSLKRALKVAPCNYLHKIERYSHEHVAKDRFYDDCNPYYTLHRWKYSISSNCAVHKASHSITLINRRWEDFHGSVHPPLETRSIIQRRLRTKLKCSKFAPNMCDTLESNFKQYYLDTTYYSLGACAPRAYAPLPATTTYQAKPLQTKVIIQRRADTFLEASMSDEEFVISGTYEHPHHQCTENFRDTFEASLYYASKTLHELETKFNKKLEVVADNTLYAVPSQFMHGTGDIDNPSTEFDAYTIEKADGEAGDAEEHLQRLRNNLDAHNSHIDYLKGLTFDQTSMVSAVFPQGIRFTHDEQLDEPICASFLRNLNAQYWGLIRSWPNAYARQLTAMTSATTAYVTIAESDKSVMPFSSSSAIDPDKYTDMDSFLQDLLKCRYDTYKYNRLRAQEKQLYSVCSDALPDLSKLSRRKRNQILNSYDIMGNRITNRAWKVSGTQKGGNARGMVCASQSAANPAVQPAQYGSTEIELHGSKSLVASSSLSERSMYRSLLSSSIRITASPLNREIHHRNHVQIATTPLKTKIFLVDIQGILHNRSSRETGYSIGGCLKTILDSGDTHGHSAQNLTKDLVYTHETYALADHSMILMAANSTANVATLSRSGFRAKSRTRPRSLSACSSSTLTSIKMRINGFIRAQTLYKAREFPVYLMELIILRASEQLTCSLMHVFRPQKHVSLFRMAFEQEFTPTINKPTVVQIDLPQCTDSSGFAHTIYGSEEVMNTYTLINSKISGPIMNIYDQPYAKRILLLPIDSIDYRSFLIRTKAIDKHIKQVSDMLHSQKTIRQLELRNMQLKLLVQSTRMHSEEMAPCFDLWNRMIFNAHHVLSMQAAMRHSEYFESLLKQFNGDLNTLIERAIAINHTFYAKHTALFREYQAIKRQKDMEYRANLEQICYLMREVMQHWRLHGPIYNISGLILISQMNSDIFKDALDRCFPTYSDSMIQKQPPRCLLIDATKSQRNDNTEGVTHSETSEKDPKTLALSYQSTRPTTATSCSSKTSRKQIIAIADENELDMHYRILHLFLSRLVLIELSARMFHAQHKHNMLTNIQFAVPAELDAVFTRLPQKVHVQSDTLLKSIAHEGLVGGQSRIGVFDYTQGLSTEEMDAKQIAETNHTLTTSQYTDMESDKLSKLKSAATTLAKTVSRPSTSNVMSDVKLVTMPDSTLTLTAASPTKGMAIALKTNNLNVIIKDIEKRLNGLQKGDLDNFDESIIEFNAQSESFMSAYEDHDQGNYVSDIQSSDHKDFDQERAHKRNRRVTISEDSHAPSAHQMASSSSRPQSGVTYTQVSKLPTSASTQNNIPLNVKKRSARSAVDRLRSMGMMTPSRDKDLAQILERLIGPSKDIADAVPSQTSKDCNGTEDTPHLMTTKLPRPLSIVKSFSNSSTMGKRTDSQASRLSFVKSAGVRIPRSTVKELMSPTVIDITPEHFSLNLSLRSSCSSQEDNERLSNFFTKHMTSTGKVENQRRCQSSLERRAPMSAQKRREEPCKSQAVYGGNASRDADLQNRVSIDNPFIVCTGTSLQKGLQKSQGLQRKDNPIHPRQRSAQQLHPMPSLQTSENNSFTYSFSITDPAASQPPSKSSGSSGQNPPPDKKVSSSRDKKAPNPWKKEPSTGDTAPKEQYMSQSYVYSLTTGNASIDQGLANNFTESELMHIEAIGKRKLKAENNSTWTTIGGIARPGSGIGTRSYSRGKRV